MGALVSQRGNPGRLDSPVATPSALIYNEAASDFATKPTIELRLTCSGARNYILIEQTPNQPLYVAKDRVPFNLTLILALGIAAWGVLGMFELIPPPGNPTMIIILGIGVSAYTWLFTPREYLVYSDSLCVAYGRPRVKVMHFSNIATVEMGSLATMDQLRIRPVKGRRQPIRVRDPEGFFDELEAALNAYRAAHPEENMDYEFRGRRPLEVVDAESVAVVDAVEATPIADTAPEAPASEPSQDMVETAGNSVEEPVATEQAKAPEPSSAEEQPVAQANEAVEEAPASGPDDSGDDPQQPQPRTFY